MAGAYGVILPSERLGYIHPHRLFDFSTLEKSAFGLVGENFSDIIRPIEEESEPFYFSLCRLFDRDCQKLTGWITEKNYLLAFRDGYVQSFNGYTREIEMIDFRKQQDGDDQYIYYFCRGTHFWVSEFKNRILETLTAYSFENGTFKKVFSAPVASEGPRFLFRLPGKEFAIVTSKYQKTQTGAVIFEEKSSEIAIKQLSNDRMVVRAFDQGYLGLDTRYIEKTTLTIHFFSTNGTYNISAQKLSLDFPGLITGVKMIKSDYDILVIRPTASLSAYREEEISSVYYHPQSQKTFGSGFKTRALYNKGPKNFYHPTTHGTIYCEEEGDKYRLRLVQRGPFFDDDPENYLDPNRVLKRPPVRPTRAFLKPK